MEFPVSAPFDASRMSAQIGKKGAIQISLKNGRVDVTFSANCGGITQLLSGYLNGLGNIFFCPSLLCSLAQFSQSMENNCRSSPGTEILGRKILASDLANI